MTIMAIVRNKLSIDGNLSGKATLRKSVGGLSDHEQSDTDDRTYLRETFTSGSLDDSIAALRRHPTTLGTYRRSERGLYMEHAWPLGDMATPSARESARANGARPRLPMRWIYRCGRMYMDWGCCIFPSSQG